MEAMKMQTSINAPCDGHVAELAVKFADNVDINDLLLKMKA